MAVDGSYHISGEAMGTKLDGTIAMQTKGDVLTGTATIGSVKIPIENGKAKGDSFTCTINAPTPMGNMRFKVQGTVSGDQISGTLKALLVNAKFQGSRI